MWEILNAEFRLFSGTSKAPSELAYVGHETPKLSCSCEDLDFPTLNVLCAKWHHSSCLSLSAHSDPLSGDWWRGSWEQGAAVCLEVANKYWFRSGSKRDRPEQVPLCPSCSVAQGHRAGFQDFWGMTCPCDSGINQDHKTKEKSVCFQEGSVKQKCFGGRGGEWSTVGTSPIPPTQAFFFPPFGLKFQSSPVDPGLHSQGLAGNPIPPPPHHHHFLALKILICIIQSLIDSSWLLRMCFVVTHQHSTFKLKWVCPPKCWVSIRFCQAHEPCCNVFLFVRISIWAFWSWFLIHFSRTWFCYLKCWLLGFLCFKLFANFALLLLLLGEEAKAVSLVLCLLYLCVGSETVKFNKICWV